MLKAEFTRCCVSSSEKQALVRDQTCMIFIRRTTCDRKWGGSQKRQGEPPDSTASPTSSEGEKGGKSGWHHYRGVLKPTLGTGVLCLSGRSVPALLSHPRWQPVEAYGFQIDHSSPWSVSSPIVGGLRNSFLGPPCDGPCSIGLAGTLTWLTTYIKKVSCWHSVICIFYI